MKSASPRLSIPPRAARWNNFRRSCSRARWAAALPATMLGSALGPGETALTVMRDVLGAIEHRLDAVRTGVERRRSLADATPSIWPVAGWLTSAFGNRRDPFTGGSDFHPGLDISADRGDEVLAPATGTVSMACGTAATATWSSSTTASASSRSTATSRASACERPAGQSRRRHRLRRLDRPLDQLAPALRDLGQRQADEPDAAARLALERVGWPTPARTLVTSSLQAAGFRA